MYLRIPSSLSFGHLVSSFVAILGYILLEKAQIQHDDQTPELKSISYMWNTIQLFCTRACHFFSVGHVFIPTPLSQVSRTKAYRMQHPLSFSSSPCVLSSSPPFQHPLLSLAAISPLSLYLFFLFISFCLSSTSSLPQFVHYCIWCSHTGVLFAVFKVDIIITPQ